MNAIAPPADIRMIALDLDGTLLTTDKRITDRTLRALRAASDRGVLIVPATGRLFRGLPPVVRELPFLKYAILSNGAAVYDVDRDRVLYRAEIPVAQALEIIQWLRTLPVIFDCNIDGRCWMEAGMLDRVEQYIDNPVTVRNIRAVRQTVPDIGAFVRANGRDLEKLQIFCPDADTQARLLRCIPFERVAVSSSVPLNAEINHEDAHKGAGMRALGRCLGIAPEQIMAFGDGLNDLSMVRDAGFGVAMANAAEAVKAVAMTVTSDNDSDGVAEVIENWVWRSSR